MLTAIVDLVLLAGVACIVFGVGSSILIFSRHTPIDPRHPWEWFTSTYTLWRWLTNPWKVCLVFLLWQANFQQLALTGPVATFAGELDFRSRLYITLANLIGTSVVLYAMHLKEWRLSLLIELVGNISLIGTLGLWVTLVYLFVPLPNTSYGLNSVEAVVIGGLIRSTCILLYLRSERRQDVEKQVFWRQILGGGSLGHTS